MTVKNLILDLDNTLYRYGIPYKRALPTVLKTYSNRFKISEEKTKQSFGRAWQNNHLKLPARAASYNRLLYFQKMLEYHGLDSLRYALEFYWGTLMDQMTRCEGLPEYLDHNGSKGGKVCRLTDLTAYIQYRKIKKLGIANAINFLLTSEEVGTEKPHPYILTRALQKLQCNASEALMIGDSWAKDIVGSDALGIRSIRINHKKERS